MKPNLYDLHTSFFARPFTKVLYMEGYGRLHTIDDYFIVSTFKRVFWAR